MTDAGPAPTALRGLLFDKDGTLFDFHASWRGLVVDLLARIAPDSAALAAMAAAAGYDPESGRFVPGSPIVAGSTAEVAAVLAPLSAGLTAAEIEAMANDAAEAMAGSDALVPAVPDLAGLMAELAAQGCILGIATHDSEAGARAQVGAAGALGAFAFVAGYDSDHGLKPGPGMLQAFCAATGLRAAEVAVIGDSLHDLHMARNGGAGLAIGVLTGPAVAEDLAPHADVVLPSIAGLPALLAARG